VAVENNTSAQHQSASVTWESPSNIAIVKYWGKYGRQLPKNPSVSMTLSAAKTRTTLKWRKGTGALSSFLLSGQENVQFASRVGKFISSISDELPFIREVDFEIETENTFPHSAGIASSASGMSALAIALVSAGQRMGALDQFDLNLVSRLSRLGSGSACRSVNGPWMVWGNSKAFPGSNDDFAVKAEHVHEVFEQMHDAILIVSEGEKPVSSSAGHGLMETNPHAGQRFANAYANCVRLERILRSGDLPEFVRIAEAEALELHALMMTSEPSFILMKPATLEIIEKLRAFRTDTGIQVCFTLDAGPNVHVLYPNADKDKVEDFIKDELVSNCVGGRVLWDMAGEGPLAI
jgi:diphosphomevalonate decarboxylase